MKKSIINISKINKSTSITTNYTPSVIKNFLHVQKVGVKYCGADYCIKNRYMDSALIVYIKEGKGTLEYDGKTYELEKGNMFVINCNVEHSYYANNDEPFVLIYMHYAPPQIGIKAEIYTSLFLKENEPVVTDEKCIENILNYISTIMNELENETSVSYLTCSTIIYNIVVELLKVNEYNNRTKDKAIMPVYVLETKKYIENNYTKTLNVEALAEKVSFSSYHLIREFKKHVGYTPYEYLLICKFAESKNLLINTNININEIAEKLNFSSTSHFISAFTRREKMSPLKFRQSNTK